MTRNEILELVEKVHNLNKDKDSALPDNSYFLEENTVLCYPRKFGDSRYPYYRDGLVLFPHTSGYLDCVDGMFNIFRCANYNEDTPIAFFAGEKRSEGFFPISITGAARQLFEDNIVRYTVFTPVCAYYIVEAPEAVYAVRCYVDEDKHIRFSVGAVNTGKKREIYLASFFEPMLRYIEAEGFFNRMTKYGEHFECGSYLMMSLNRTFDCLAVNTKVEGNSTKKHFTTSKKTVLGIKGGCLTNSLAFARGCYDAEIPKTNTTDIPVISDMVHFDLEEGGFAAIDYDMLVTDNKGKAEAFIGKDIDVAEADKKLALRKVEEKTSFDTLDINFGDWYKDTLSPKVINSFIKCVQRQISFCALGKNYAGPLLGIRDVFQQLEASLIWQKDESRAQIVKVMNYILEDGRAPRQISFPTEENPIPDMDLRPYIDQGFWIISTLHTYLAYTDDFSILDEMCGYYKAEDTFGPLTKSEKRDTILDHLIRIANYLVSNLDEKTNCIHALWGDWNDALDGLGRTKDEGKEFGDGVSVMATLQLYLALEQLCDILEYTGKNTELTEGFKAERNRIAKGFKENAVAEGNEGKRVVHGWGDKKAYYVGSYNDYDSKSRLSLTANAFYAISNMVNTYPEIKEDIAKNILSLDSKYGLITFDKPFDTFAPEVGRLSTITPGTYENSCAYVHASTFGIMALFMMGYAEQAWEELEKAMVISHNNATRTTFVMPNSYCYTEEYSSDGDSMGDWYTGSGTVLVKELIKNGFGIQPTMDSLIIAPPAFMPTNTAEISLNIKGCKLTLCYENKGEGKRSILLNDTPLNTMYNEISATEYAVIPKENLGKEAVIKIID